MEQHSADWQAFWTNLRALPVDAFTDEAPALQAEQQAAALLLQRTLQQALQKLYPALAD